MRVSRLHENPILKPSTEHSWEYEAVFNGCPVKRGSTVFLLYRAVSLPHYHANVQTQMQVSDIGIAESPDGVHFSNRRRFIVPTHSWERYGCEDPRVTKLGSKYYIFYTALSEYPFRAEGIKIGVAVTKDLKRVDEKHLVTPFNAKAMALFPEKIGGKIWAVLTAHTDMPPAKICLVSFRKESDMWSEKYWNNWYARLNEHVLHLQRSPQDQVEVGAPPVKTPYGWLLIYSYIRNYFAQEHRLFSMEAALLDLKDPSKILAHTRSPLLVPEEYYERHGIVPNIVFPSGALVEKDVLRIYYGAADTTVCIVETGIHELTKSILASFRARPVKFERLQENPLLAPDPSLVWKAKAVFNPAAIYAEGKVHMLYRAMSQDNTSVLGYAASRDGMHFDEQEPEPAYIPRERFEQKQGRGNSGCEDPRLTILGDTLYMCYTAFDGTHPPRIAFTSIPLKKFLRKKWDWARPVLISPPDSDNKDAAIFPEKLKTGYLIFHRMGQAVDIAHAPNLRFDGKTWLEENIWLKPRPWTWDNEKVGIASPPVKTKRGWILLYHGVSQTSRKYRVGAVLLDLKDPARILARTEKPLLEPEEPYEINGQVPNVVFPCGSVILGKDLFVYYGGGDSVVAGARIPLEKLLAAFG